MFPGGPGGMFGMMNLMNQMLQDIPPPMVPQQPQQFQGHHQQQAYVEELHAGAPAAGGQQQQQAIVEEPDDDAPGAGAHAPQQQRQQHAHYPQHPQQPHYHPQAMPPPPFPPLLNPFGGFDGLFGTMGMGMQAPAGGQVFSYSSSTVISSGPNGTYHSSTTSRQAPGVRETQATVRDGRIGHESMTIARGIGDRERVVSRTRDASGQVVTHEQNRGLDPASAQQFDQEWRAQAQQAMPPWMQQQGGGGAQRLQGGAGGGQRQQQLALPPAAGVAQQQQQYYGGGGTGWQGGYRV